MKKLFNLFIIGILFTLVSCNFTPITIGWRIDNKTSQDIDVYFNSVKYTVEAGNHLYSENIPVDADISIAETYHVNYETSYYYPTNSYSSKWLIIKDKIKYQYEVKNITGVTLNYSINSTDYTISNNEIKNITVYDRPASFTFTSDDGYVYTYTSNLVNGVYKILIN